jgi:rRNA-processing protein FCF1
LVTPLEKLIGRCASRGILIDTNLLLVYLAGLFDRAHVGRIGRSKGYSPEDFDLLARLIRPFRTIFVTPQILAELSNLSPDGANAAFARYYAGLVKVLRDASEEHVPKDLMLGSPALPRIGFTDLSIVEAAKKHKCLVLTDDFRAAGYVRSANVPVLNMNQLRGEAWLREQS